MKYNSKEMYIATLAQNEGNSITYCGDILCTVKENKVEDLLTEEESYRLLDFENRHLASEGEIYVIGISNFFPKKYKGVDLSTKEELIELANELNNDWANIIVSSGIVK